jgi:hypothetical protein
LKKEGGPKPLWVDLADVKFDPERYDRAHGEGHAQAVIDELIDALLKRKGGLEVSDTFSLI